jgi:hypothetical protein
MIRSALAQVGADVFTLDNVTIGFVVLDIEAISFSLPPHKV